MDGGRRLEPLRLDPPARATVTTVERLWTPWRFAYVTAIDSVNGCVFCDVADPQQDDLILVRGRACYVILNRYPYNNGHLLIVTNRHVATLAGTSGDELAELIRFTRHGEIALTEAYQPQGINVGINLGRPAGAGIADHLHVHLVPRWTGDTNFMSVVGNVRVLPEELCDTAQRLRPIFEQLSRETPGGVI